MDKLVLEKLLHLYKLVPQKPNDPFYTDNEMMISLVGNDEVQVDGDSSWLKFKNNISFPKSMEPNSSTIMNPIAVRKKLKELSEEIQRAGKFYYDASYLDQIISAEDFDKLCKEVPQVLPYETTFLQVCVRNKELIHGGLEGDVLTNNYLIKEVHDSAEIRNAKSHGHFKESDKYFSLSCYQYVHSEKMFSFNPLTVHYCIGAHGSVQKDKNALRNITVYQKHSLEEKRDADIPFTFWIDHESYDNKNWQDFYDQTEDENGVLSNPHLNREISINGGILQMLFVLLAFPQLCRQEEVKGKKPMVFGSMTPYKASELRRKPTWEHKTLVVNLTQEEKQIIDEARESGVQGKRFHAVRSHVRRLASGKMTIVKSHFRGDKSLGVIQKDYKIK